jgi:hypothetical protein
MNYDPIAIRDAEVPKAVEPVFQHVVTTYASEANKTVSMWRAVPDDLLDFKPHEKTNPIRLAGELVPAIYGPSGDVKWDEADPIYSLEAAKRGG